jgi:hypothetical protein
MLVSSPVFGWAKTPSGFVNSVVGDRKLLRFVESVSRPSESQQLAQP